MRTDRFGSLILLLLAATLAGACGARKSQVRTTSNNSSPATSNNSSPATTNNSSPAVSNSTANRGAVRTRVYRAPGGAFTLNLPEGWRVEREPKDGADMTVIRPAEGRAANLSILTGKAAPAEEEDSAEFRSYMLSESSYPFFLGWIEELKEQARVEDEGQPAPTQLDQTDALRKDVTYYRGDADDPRRGRCIYLVGEKTFFFISLTASRSRFGELEEIVNTLRVEP
ncbi:MAG: hypothetical protein ACJ754_03875 [Pyrinomonadaceae bacterium]